MAVMVILSPNNQSTRNILKVKKSRNLAKFNRRLANLVGLPLQFASKQKISNEYCERQIWLINDFLSMKSALESQKLDFMLKLLIISVSCFPYKEKFAKILEKSTPWKDL